MLAEEFSEKYAVIYYNESYGTDLSDPFAVKIDRIMPQ
jgi:hypothetical protein